MSSNVVEQQPTMRRAADPPGPEVPPLAAHDLAIGYGSAPMLAANLQLSLLPGELVCLMGPNGAGKSTLLRTLAGVQSARQGQVLLHGQEIGTVDPIERARCIAVVLTDRIEPANLSIRDLVALGRYPHTGWMGRLSPTDRQAIDQAIRWLDLESLAHRPLARLSDGERQKGFIARALAQEPQILILDEPTAFLDVPRRVEILRKLRQYAHGAGKCVLLSTHDLDLALRSANRLWLLSATGSLVQGVPEDLVLAGDVAQVFRREGVDFDPARGTFQFERPTRAPVAVIGDGMTAHWTRHALERAGFSVVDGAADLVVEVVGPGTWRSGAGGVVAEHQTLAGLLDAFAKLSPGRQGNADASRGNSES